jgi:hypothetical protein
MLEIWSRGIKSKPSSITEFHKLSHIFFSTKAHMTTLPTITQHNVLENRPLVQKLHYASLRKTLVLRSSNKHFSRKWNDNGGAPLAETRCPDPMQLMVHPSKSRFEFYRVATHLLKPFRDMLAIWSGGIKSKLSSIMEFHKLPHVYLAKAHMTMLPTIS